MRHRHVTALTATAAALLLALGGCLGLPGSTPAEAEAPEPDATDANAPEPQESPPEEEQEVAIEPEIEELLLGEGVFYAGVEYQFESMSVVDLDAENGEDSPRLLGLELTFDVTAYNPGDDTVMPIAPLVLRWDEAGTANVSEVNGQGEFNQVPSDSSTSGTVVFTLPPDALETYDADSARVILGRGDEAAATLPLGSSAELVTRFPVIQQQLHGEGIQAGPLEVTFEKAEVRWNYGTPQMGQAAAEEALLVLEMSVDNTHEAQVCTRRGAGKTMSLKDASGHGYADLGLSERCFQAGATAPSTTGFEIDADYEGTYELEFDVDPVGSEVWMGESTIDLVAGEGEAPSTSG